MKKSIWIFNHYAGSPSITTGTRHYNFGKYLIRDGHSVTIFAASTIHNSDKNLITDNKPYILDDSEGVPFVYIKARDYRGNGIKRVLNMLYYYRGLFKVTENFEKPDVIIGSSVHLLACVAAIKLAKKHHCECIVEIRDLWPESIVVYNGVSRNNPVIQVLYKLEKWLYKKADKLIFTIPGGKKYIVEHAMDKQHGGGVDTDKVYYLNNGINLNEFEQNARTFQAEDPDLDNPNTYKIVYTGSIRLVNNIRKLVDAAAIIQEKGDNNIRFIVYGDGGERSELEKYCKDHYIDNIIFKGSVKKQCIPYILSKCNAAYNEGTNNPLFQYGSSANKQFDYYAAGLPTISSAVYWHDIIEEYECGFVTSEDSPQALVDSIFRSYKLSPEEYVTMRENALQAAHDFDFSILSKHLINIIETTR